MKERYDPRLKNCNSHPPAKERLKVYRMQLENFLPYFNYQNQILFYLTGDKNLDIQAPMNLRFLGLITQYIIFKFIPCIELTNINTILYQNNNYLQIKQDK